MKHRLLLLVWLLSHTSRVFSQQVLCERELRTNATALVQTVTLLRLQMDSLRLVSDNFPTFTPLRLRTRVQRLAIGSCDTLAVGPSVVRVSNPATANSVACSNRRGQTLVAVQLAGGLTITNGDSIRFGVQLFNRNGTSRWFRSIRPQTSNEGVTGLIEAPGNGFFIVGFQTSGMGNNNAFLMRIDSLGNVQWRRSYRRRGSFDYSNPVYTRTGTLLLNLFYVEPPFAFATGVAEFNQQGDSLTTRRVLLDPQQLTRPTIASGSLLPLRDGGFALVGVVDSANTGRDRPFLARLDRNLNLTWSYIYRAQPATPFLPPLGYQFAQPQELADGSLLVVASNAQSGRGYPFWLFRFTATGTLQQAYPFVSQVLTANTSGGRNGFFGTAKGLQPLSDSSLVVVAGGSDLNSSRIYLAHLRVPGLPRVIDSHYVPAAQPLAARPGRASSGAGLQLYPNPAREQVRVAYTLPTGTNAATLELHDALGRLLLRQALPPSRAESQLALDHLPAGLYSATLTADGMVRARTRLLIAR